MPRIQKMPVLILSMILLFATPSLAHHLWVVQTDDGYRVARGVIPDRVDAYDPLCIKQIRGYGKDGRQIDVHRHNEKHQVLFTPETKPAIATVHAEWGYRCNTTSGKKLMARKEAEEEGLKVISTFFSTQFAKTLFLPCSCNPIPLDMKFEIVPSQDPLRSESENKLPVALLFDGEPLTNTEIYTLEGRKFKTDQKGKANIRFEKGGVRLLYAKHTVPAEKGADVDYLQFMTFLIFEVK